MKGMHLKEGGASKSESCGAYERDALKRGRRFKVRGIIHIKFRNLVISSFQIAINNYCLVLYISKKLIIFKIVIGYILVSHAF